MRPQRGTPDRRVVRAEGLDLYIYIYISSREGLKARAGERRRLAEWSEGEGRREEGRPAAFPCLRVKCITPWFGLVYIYVRERERRPEGLKRPPGHGLLAETSERRPAKGEGRAPVSPSAG